MKDIDWLLSVCALNGLPMTRLQADQLERYRNLLLTWNSKLNLISRKDEEHFYSRHVLNSVSFLFSHRFKHGGTVLDLGTGGGLPGVPIKILVPDLRVVLLDSIGKKTMALSEIVDGLSLAEVRVVTGRAEEIAGKDEFYGVFDYVVSRGAGKLHEVVKWSRLFLGEYQPVGQYEIPKGVLIVLKGGGFTDELNVARKLKFVESVEVHDISFHGMDDADNKEKKLVLVTYRGTSKDNRMKRDE